MKSMPTPFLVVIISVLTTVLMFRFVAAECSNYPDENACDADSDCIWSCSDNSDNNYAREASAQASTCECGDKLTFIILWSVCGGIALLVGIFFAYRYWKQSAETRDLRTINEAHANYYNDNSKNKKEEGNEELTTQQREYIDSLGNKNSSLNNAVSFQNSIYDHHNQNNNIVNEPTNDNVAPPPRAFASFPSSNNNNDPAATV